MTTVKRLARIEMVCDNPDELSAFYCDAFGFLESDTVENVTGGRTVRMRLGNQEIALIAVEPKGRPYPENIAGWNPLFQHIAIVTPDISSAYARLSYIAGWTPISTEGPQLLPSASGGVTAFKFRDPVGHPLELIAFPHDRTPAQWRTSLKTGCLGIDHSAISVADTAKSIAFYEDLGLTRTAGSLNIGPEQEKLDHVPNAVVEVSALAPNQSTPHLELLCYRGNFNRHVRQNINDITATRLVFPVDGHDELELLCARHVDCIVREPTGRRDKQHSALLRDPDGHLVCLDADA